MFRFKNFQSFIIAKVSLELSTRTKLLFTIFEVYVFFHYEF
jgi:hypothetical protein